MGQAFDFDLMMPAHTLPKSLREQAFEFAPKYEATIIPVEGKEPTEDANGYRDWDEWFDRPLEDLPWDKATGFAIVCGWGYYRCLDFDYTGKGIQEVIIELLSLLSLPTDYRWLVRTGQGYHLWVRTTDAPLDGIDVTRFVPEKGHEGAFAMLEWRYKNAYALVPPSQCLTGGQYTFVHRTPDLPPPLLDYQTVDNAIKTIATYHVEVCGGCYQELPYCTCGERDEYDEDW